MSKKKIIKTIEALEEILVQLRELVDVPVKIQDIENKENDLRVLLSSNEWPEAINMDECCESNEDKEERAAGLLAEILGDVDLTDKKFLDFGCGEGFTIQKVKDASLAIGYDIIRPDESVMEWEGSGDKFLTTNLDKVKEHAPFDIIWAYDVVDHATDQHEMMNTILELSDENTKIYVRCHPWSSRHGSHLYKQLNKAFIHLIFTDEQLDSMGCKRPFVQKTLFPINAYNNLFRSNHFTVENMQLHKFPVEKFFITNQLLHSILLKRFMRSNNKKGFPIKQLETSFVDFVLKKKQD